MTAQSRALKSYRDRLKQRGMTRFEVLAPEGDRALIRELAKRLVDGGPEATQIRAQLTGLEGAEPSTGNIWAGLRSSPLVGADLDLTRENWPERSVDL